MLKVPKGAVSILSPEDFTEEMELVWGCMEVIQCIKASPLALAKHGHRLRVPLSHKGT